MVIQGMGVGMVDRGMFLLDLWITCSIFGLDFLPTFLTGVKNAEIPNKSTQSIRWVHWQSMVVFKIYNFVKIQWHYFYCKFTEILNFLVQMLRTLLYHLLPLRCSTTVSIHHVSYCYQCKFTKLFFPRRWGSNFIFDKSKNSIGIGRIWTWGWNVIWRWHF